MRNPLLLLISLIPLIIISQDELISNRTFDSMIKLPIETDIYSKAEGVSYDDSDDFLLIYTHLNDITVYQVNKFYKIEGSLSSSSGWMQRHTLAGAHIDNELHHLYYVDVNNRNWKVITLNFKEEKIEIQEIEVPKRKKEKVLRTLFIKGKPYLVSVIKNSSFIHFTEVTNLSNVLTLDLNTFYNFNENTEYQNLYDCISKLGIRRIGVGAALIERGRSLSFSTTRSKNKFYIDEENLLLTLDNPRQKTVIFNIDLNSFEVSARDFPKDFLKDTGLFYTNSAIFDDKLFQITKNHYDLCIKITDLNNGNLLHKYEVRNQSEIPFKNTPIYYQKYSEQKGAQFDTSSTQQFLWNPEKPSFSFTKTMNDSIIMSVGSYDILKEPVAMGVTDIDRNNYIHQYVYFSSLLNSNGKHIAGTLGQQFGLDQIIVRITRFLQTHQEGYHSQSVFGLKDKMVVGIDPSNTNDGYYLYFFNRN